MTVLRSGEACWKKQACPEFISLKSGGGGLRKHIANSILGKKEKNSSPSQSGNLEGACGTGASFKNIKGTVTVFGEWRGSGVADLPGAMKSGLAAVLFWGSTDLTPPTQETAGGSRVMWRGGQGWGRGRGGGAEVRLC